MQVTAAVAAPVLGSCTVSLLWVETTAPRFKHSSIKNHCMLPIEGVGSKSGWYSSFLLCMSLAYSLSHVCWPFRNESILERTSLINTTGWEWELCLNLCLAVMISITESCFISHVKNWTTLLLYFTALCLSYKFISWPWSMLLQS